MTTELTSGAKILAGLKDAVDGNFARVTIGGQVWVREDRAETAGPFWTAGYNKAWSEARTDLDRKNAEIAGLRAEKARLKTSNSVLAVESISNAVRYKFAGELALMVICAARYGQSWSGNMLKDFDAAIEASHAARQDAEEKARLRDVLTGGDAQQPDYLYPAGWLDTLLKLCAQPHVRAALDRDTDDPEATDTMLGELRSFVTKARAELAALQLSSSHAGDILSLRAAARQDAEKLAAIHEMILRTRTRAALVCHPQCGADPMHCVLDELVRSARHVSNTRKPWSDNNYGRAASALAWCLPSDDARHPNNGGPWNGDDIACRPQGEKS